MHIPLKTASRTALAVAAVLVAPPVWAQTVVRPGDDALTCRQMADEAATLSAQMGDRGPGLLGRAAGVARAGVSILAPVAGLAVAGAEALTGSGGEKKEAEADARRDRWNYLNGLYAGRDCDEAVAQPATQTTTQAPTLVPAPASPQSSARSAPRPDATTAATLAPPPPTVTPAALED